MIKLKKTITTGLAALLAMACLSPAGAVAAWAAPVTSTTIVPAGQTSFSIDLRVNEGTAYVGAQFSLAVSGGSDALELVSFTPRLSGASAIPSVSQDGYEHFGFMSQSNSFPSGDSLAGTLNFTGYTGNQTLTVTIESMKVARLRASEPDAAGNIWQKSDVTEKESPAYVFTVQRAGASAGPDGNGSQQPGATTPGSGTGSVPGSTPASSSSSTSGSVATVIGDGNAPLAGLLPFDDVKSGDWFYSDVEYAYAQGLMTGTSATKFSPGDNLTRCMAVTILGRQAKADASSQTASAFSDVAAGQYYAPYTAWAEQSGVVQGVGGGRFEPERLVTRQELAAMLQRYAAFAKLALAETRAYAQFADETAIAGYAKEGVRALYSAGVINGKPGGLFDPAGTATRAETAAMIHRLLLATGK